jgi:hypothetical protein
MKRAHQTLVGLVPGEAFGDQDLDGGFDQAYPDSVFGPGQVVGRKARPRGLKKAPCQVRAPRFLGLLEPFGVTPLRRGTAGELLFAIFVSHRFQDSRRRPVRKGNTSAAAPMTLMPKLIRRGRSLAAAGRQSGESDFLNFESETEIWRSETLFCNLF